MPERTKQEFTQTSPANSNLVFAGYRVVVKDSKTICCSSLVRETCLAILESNKSKM